MDKFYCIWVEGTTGGYHHKHPTFEAAKTEAERLAKQPGNKGRKVYVLEAIGYCEVPETPVVWHNILWQI